MYSDRVLRDCMLDGHAYCFAGHTGPGLKGNDDGGRTLKSRGSTRRGPLNRAAYEAFSLYERGDASNVVRN